jgi:superfamily II DNA or RNA helicase
MGSKSKEKTLSLKKEHKRKTQRKSITKTIRENKTRKTLINPKKTKSKSTSEKPKFALELKPHQTKVVDYMWKTDSRGVILYHGLGSGKTITSIAISQLYPQKKVIVVVPASMRTQWKEELTKMKSNMNNYKIFSYEGYDAAIKGKPDLVEGAIVILDEAHRVRNPGKTSTVINRSLKDSDKVILLTGTPMVNTPLDMSSLINIIQGNKVMPVTDEQFEDHFMITKSMNPPAMKDRCTDYSAITCSDSGRVIWFNRCTYHYYKHMLKQSKDIREKEEFFRSLDYEEQQEKRIAKKREQLKFIPKQPNLSQYSRYVRCMVSYYMPDLAKDYPAIEKWFIKVHMSEIQSDLYNKALNSLPLPDRKAMQKGIEIKDSGGGNYINAFFNKTRQISNTWAGNPNTPKLRQIARFIYSNPKPAIVYSHWIENGIDAIAKILMHHKISFAKFTGSMTDKNKNDVVKLYNQGELDVLLLSSSGGEGLDLKNTRQIHIMEPHWNFAKINQVIGRGVRYKSHESLPKDERKVSVYYWISIPDLDTMSVSVQKSISYKRSITRKTADHERLGADEYLYQVGQDKVDNMEKFLETIVGYSIENNPNCIKEGIEDRKKRNEVAKIKLKLDMEFKKKTMPQEKDKPKKSKKSKSKSIKSKKSKSIKSKKSKSKSIKSKKSKSIKSKKSKSKSKKSKSKSKKSKAKSKKSQSKATIRKSQSKAIIRKSKSEKSNLKSLLNKIQSREKNSAKSKSSFFK